MILNFSQNVSFLVSLTLLYSAQSHLYLLLVKFSLLIFNIKFLNWLTWHKSWNLLVVITHHQQEIIMGIMNRVTDLIQANLVSALDKAEDPEKLLNLVIQQMQQTLDECRSTAAVILCEEKALKREQAQKQVSIDNWQTKAELAVTKGRDDLATAALKEKQHVSDELAAIEPELVKLADSLKKLQDDAQRLQSKLTEAKAKQASLQKVHNLLDARMRVNHQLNSEKIADALSRFDVIERRVESIESQVDAYDMTKTQSSTAEQIDALVKDEALEQEFAALKVKMKQTA